MITISKKHEKKLKVLHTSDWHLGHTLYYKRQEEEQQYFLRWLVEEIKNQSVDVLVIAGDIFDQANPSHRAFELYYQFLKEISLTSLTATIIIAGNHDSPRTLLAPKELLKFFHIEIIGQINKDKEGNEQQQIKMIGPSEKPLCLVAAIPFIRERDLISYQTPSHLDQRESLLQEKIKNHYRQVAEWSHSLKNHFSNSSSMPIIGVGHLDALGGILSGSEQNFYFFSQDGIKLDSFAHQFDYLALGHFHQKQNIPPYSHVYYSGSPIPYSFAEATQEKFVLLVQFEQNQLIDVTPITVPTFRPLITISIENQNEITSIEELNQKFSLLNNQSTYPLIPWIQLKLNQSPIQKSQVILEEKIKDWENNHLLGKFEIINIKKKTTSQDTKRHPFNQCDISAMSELHNFTIEDVFIKRCESLNLTAEEIKTEFKTFKELVYLVSGTGQ